MKRALLVGGGGFIGSALARRLAALGITVTVLDKAPIVHSEPGVSVVSGDVVDAEILARELKGVDVVVHLAHSAVRLTVDAALSDDVLQNIIPSIQLFEAALRSQAKRVVFVSTGGAVYGEAGPGSITELFPANPISLYGMTKLTIENYGMLLHRQRDLPFVIVRPSNAYGPGQRPFTGQGFVATAAASILTAKKIELFGSGDCARDYIFITDLLEGIVAAMIHGRIGHIYNIGTDAAFTQLQILDLLRVLANKEGRSISVVHKHRRSVDVKSNRLSGEKLYEDTGFRAKVPLDEGLERTWVWLKEALLISD